MVHGQGLRLGTHLLTLGLRVQNSGFRAWGYLGALRAALGVDVGGRLLGVGGARQHHISSKRAPIPVMALQSHSPSFSMAAVVRFY